MTVLSFTGTRRGLTHEQRSALGRLLVEIDPSIAAHGDCVGADAEFHDLAAEMAITIWLFPGDDPRQRAFCAKGLITMQAEPAPPLDRNRVIVDNGEALVACPGGRHEEMRSGTWATVRYARKRGKKLWIVWPDGAVTRENHGE